jgi:hypothetical protein
VQSLQRDNQPGSNPRLFRVINRYVGNLPPMPGVFPDYPAPVVRNASDERDMVLMRWGMPPPPRTGGPAVTNIRNTSSPHWRGWLKDDLPPPTRNLFDTDQPARCAVEIPRAVCQPGRPL